MPQRNARCLLASSTVVKNANIIQILLSVPGKFALNRSTDIIVIKRSKLAAVTPLGYGKGQVLYATIKNISERRRDAKKIK